MITLFLLAFFLVSGCGEAECEYDTDCPVRDCFDYTCDGGECVQSVIYDCCGNNVCEEDKGQDYCNCPEDCMPDTCEGKIDLDEQGREQTEYLQMMCRDDKCVADFDRDEQRTIPLSFERSRNHFDVNVDVNLKRPFDINTDTIDVTIRLDNKEDEMVSPLNIRRVRLSVGELRLGELTDGKDLKEIDDEISFSVPISYVPEKLEDERTVTLTLYYEYEEEMSDGETRTVRRDMDRRFTERLFMVNAGEV